MSRPATFRHNVIESLEGVDFKNVGQLKFMTNRCSVPTVVGPVRRPRSVLRCAVPSQSDQPADQVGATWANDDG